VVLKPERNCHLIMVVANDLAYAEDDPNTVIVGPETKRVCDAAYRLWRQNDKKPAVYATAGWSYKYNCFMGAGPMRAYLESLGIPSIYLETPAAVEFNTSGEMYALYSTMRFIEGVNPAETLRFRIDLVGRRFHLWPRAYFLLRARVAELRSKTIICCYPVPVQNPVRAIMHELIAVPLNFLNFF
jgi:hypothetical protein